MKKKFAFISICGGIEMGREALKQLAKNRIDRSDCCALPQLVHRGNYSTETNTKVESAKVTLENLNALLKSKGRNREE